MPDSKPPAKLAMLIVLSLLLMLCYGLEKVHCSTVHDNSEDFHSLMDFKKGITNDPSGALSNWTSNTHFCRWNGVSCTLKRPYRVMELYLPAYNLAGQISSSLGNLTYLNLLYLPSNSFHGPIPPLNKLQYLEYLYLGNNLLQGAIPETLTNCSNLTYLDLSENNLTGVIPLRIGFLTKLQYVNLLRNTLSGVIPPGLGNNTNLSLLDLSENQLNGPIPSEVWQLPKLQKLRLLQNNLSGGIPHNLTSLNSILTLVLASNRLGNSLPSNFGNALPNIQYLSLGDNMFEGHIPASLGNASRLTTLDLSDNKLTGQIPSIFRKLSGLSVLSLQYNMLEASDSTGWEFFDALTNCTSLYALSLSSNHLQGVIPNSIASLSTNVTYLLMGGNNLSGTVPSTIGRFSSLIQLSLDNNNFTGMIGEWIGNLTSLQYLNLRGNYLAGTIPPSIGNLTRLSRMDFSENKYLAGTIPPSIGNLTQLSHMDFSENKFTGTLPPSLGNLQPMAYLYLSNNNLQGSIPVEFGNLKQLVLLDVSSNKLSGKIPETLGQCKQLVTIQMDQNNLTGNIPTTFSNLNSLSVLNLSHNNLSGLLPVSVINNLQALSKLDLSYNNFQGEVPRTGIFDNASVVSLGGNPGLCGGAVDLGMPSCPVVSKRARNVNYWIKILIPIFGFLSLLLLLYFLLVVKKTSRRAHLSQLSFGEHFEKVTYNDLAEATRDFSESNLIGRGCYGSVYSGKLKESKKEVAVKVFDLEMRGAERSFLAECEALRSIQHRNLLPIITACSTVDNAGNVFKALVYELMPNGNLDTWIHHRGDEEAPKRLSLTQRIGIVVNVADALDYLHHDCGRPTVHCDLKPSNILLDDNMNALLGDFGIARFYVDPQSTWAGSISSIGLKGTIGYIPPEYGGGGHPSISGDVYSFGIVLLEILTGKRPTDPMFTDGQDIISFVENSFPDQIFHVMDAQLVEECKNLTQEKKVTENEMYQCFVALLQVALTCTHSLPTQRSTMKQVASKMHAIKTSHLGWKYK